MTKFLKGIRTLRNLPKIILRFRRSGAPVANKTGEMGQILKKPAQPVNQPSKIMQTVTENVWNPEVGQVNKEVLFPYGQIGYNWEPIPEGTQTINVADNLARTTGLPVEEVLKMINATNKARAIGPRVVEDIPESYTLTTNPTEFTKMTGLAYRPEDASQMYSGVHTPGLPLNPVALVHPMDPASMELAAARAGGIPDLLKEYGYLSGSANAFLLKSYYNNWGKPMLQQLLKRVNTPLGLSQIGRHEGDHINTIRHTSPNPLEHAAAKAMYETQSPMRAFRRGTYNGDNADEAWGAAHRAKWGASTLYHNKYGRFPGMDLHGNWFDDKELIKREVDKAMSMYDLADSPFNRYLEFQRIPAQSSYDKTMPDSNAEYTLLDWMKKPFHGDNLNWLRLGIPAAIGTGAAGLINNK